MSYPSHLRVYHYIKVIAYAGSLASASEILNIATSALSRWISNVESQIGTPLFIRLPRGLELTAVGRLYVEHAIKMLDEENRIRDNVQRLVCGDRGIVKIASVEGAGEIVVAKAIAKISNVRPEIEFEIFIDTPDAILKYLLERKADLGIFLNFPLRDKTETIFDMPAPIHVEMNSKHPLASKEVLSLKDIANYMLLLPSKDTSVYKLVQLAFLKAGLHIRTNITTNSIIPLRNMIACTNYLGFGSTLTHEPWSNTVLRPIESSILENRSISAVRLIDRPLSAAGDHFVTSLIDEIQLVLELA
jgi:DNA-binding transcriptional LysR family regulator